MNTTAEATAPPPADARWIIPPEPRKAGEAALAVNAPRPKSARERLMNALDDYIAEAVGEAMSNYEAMGDF